MKILMINVSCGTGSTGRICTDLASSLENLGHEVKIAYGRGHVSKSFQKYAVKIGNTLEVYVHAAYARLFDASGLGSKLGTRKFIKWVNEYNPDIIHLHNIHGYYINIPILFDYLKTCGKPIIWTLHDCWAFTGHTAFCDSAKCNKWEVGCEECPLLEQYPVAYTDRSRKNWAWKKKCFTNIHNMSLISPSKWLADLVQKSFLSEYKVEVIHNGIDTSVFFPLYNDFREFYGIENKRIILGIVSALNGVNGLEDFIKLSKIIDSNDVIVLVGLTQEQTDVLPANIIGIKKTNSVKELDYIYSCAEVVINLSFHSEFTKLNIKDIVNKIPVISYRDNESPTDLEDKVIFVENGDVDGIGQQLQRMKKSDEKKVFSILRSSKTHHGFFEEKNRYNLVSKYVILGVASVWDRRKGLDDFIQLHKMLSNDFYQIVLVGLSKNQIKKLPYGIRGISHTNNIDELRIIYGLADVFINPTIEDNYPTTNIEASCCGTPVITYNTGGSPESVPKSQVLEIKNMEFAKIKITQDYLKVVKRKDFDKEDMKEKYISIYDRYI